MIVENVVLSNISSIREYERNKESLIRQVKLSVPRGSNWIYNKETGSFEDIDLSSLNGKWVDYNGADTLFDKSRNQYFSTISISEDGKNFKSVAYGLGDMSIDKIKK